MTELVIGNPGEPPPLKSWRADDLDDFEQVVQKSRQSRH